MTDGRPTPAPDADTALCHEAILYGALDERDQAIRAFVHQAHDAGEPVMVAVPSAGADGLRATLGPIASDVRFVAIDVVGRNPNRLLALLEEWIGRHDGRARVISEAIWPGRSHAELIECLRHEALVNHALADAPATILCPFDAGRLDPEALRGAELTHQSVIEYGRRRASRGFQDPLRTHRADDWPLAPIPDPVTEHCFDGDLGALRRLIAAHPATLALDADRRRDLVFAVNEAATNAVRNGDSRFWTRIWGQEAEVVSEVSSATSLRDALAGRRRPRADALLGRGLWLINQLCDLVELRTDRSQTIVRMHLAAAAA